MAHSSYVGDELRDLLRQSQSYENRSFDRPTNEVADTNERQLGEELADLIGSLNTDLSMNYQENLASANILQDEVLCRSPPPPLPPTLMLISSKCFISSLL